MCVKGRYRQVVVVKVGKRYAWKYVQMATINYNPKSNKLKGNQQPGRHCITNQLQTNKSRAISNGRTKEGVKSEPSNLQNQNQRTMYEGQVVIYVFTAYE